MLAVVGLEPQEALVCTMVLVAATDGGITDREIGVMAALVQTLPAFFNFSTQQLESATEAAINLLREDDGLNHAGSLIRQALDPALRETAYGPGLRSGRCRRLRHPAHPANAGIRAERVASGPAGRCRDRTRDAGAVSPGGTRGDLAAGVDGAIRSRIAPYGVKRIVQACTVIARLNKCHRLTVLRRVQSAWIAPPRPTPSATTL